MEYERANDKNKLKLFGVAKLSKPYANVSSIAPRPQVLPLPTVQSRSDEPLAWVG